MLQGRKKNASASGVTVGGVAGAAAQAQLQAAAKKDSTHNDFYRFQQRESRRNGGCWVLGAGLRLPVVGCWWCWALGLCSAAHASFPCIRQAQLMAWPRLPHPCLPADLLDLRQRFEQDKKRIAELRASRKWKPY